LFHEYRCVPSCFNRVEEARVAVISQSSCGYLRELRSLSVEIREALDSDWVAIYPIFRAVVDEGTTYAYPSGLTSEEARPLWMEPPPGRTFVAVEDDTVLGTAKMGPNRPGRGSHVATASFMVNPQRQGHGVGRALGAHVIDSARRDGYRAIQFNAVVESNVVAVRLWEHLGFKILATVPEAFDHVDDGFVGLHVMYLKL
jgi:L-amino acid N-acyltransferase YncA